MSPSTPLSPPSRPRSRHFAAHRRAAVHAALLALLGVAAAGARADDGEGVDDLGMVDEISAAVLDADVAAAIPPGLTARQQGLATSLILAARFDTSSKAVGDANKPREVPIVKPTLPVPTSVSARPIHVARAAVDAPPSQLDLIDGQSVQLHADGLPDPNGPSGDPLAPVVPRAFNPAAVAVGARWGAQDRIDTPQIPLLPMPLPDVHLSAQADFLAGAPAPGASAVRRSLRLTAQWDDLDDFTLGLTPGVQRGGGTFFEHYVANLQASTLDPAKEARWRSFVEVAGEKLASNNIAFNSTAQMRAGASYQASRSTQFDVSVTRGTMAIPDTQSSVGLSVRF